MSLVRLNIKGISYSQTQSGAYALVLNEVDGSRTLPIVIGAFEAQSIAIALEKEIKPPRPLTHDLFKSFADSFQIDIKQVIIHKLVDGVFYSSLICERDNIEEIIDTRTSDAIALATRFSAPIFTYENILDKAGIYLKMKDEFLPQEENLEIEDLIQEPVPAKETSYAHDTLEQLQDKLNDAVLDEDYEIAAKIRDEINKRSSK
ncbi:bifunctional nuclease domain-containing protein [Lutibacter holmesii]|uniref:Bifunctional nuclease domain-containing protein n=1 Tax=Lutibacter holmesii TaxID=1137985 RepID=A0ABW3WRQ6_9FLAO